MRSRLVLVLIATLPSAIIRLASSETSESCPSALDDSGNCKVPTQPGQAKIFWDEMKRRGLQLKVKRSIVYEKAQAGRASRNRTAMVLADDVFYGRAIMKIPRPVLLSADTAALNADFRRELSKLLLEEKTLQTQFNISSEDSLHMLSLAYPLIAERRNPESVFKDWLDAVAEVRLPVLQLSERQRRVLNGTTVEGAYEEMRRNVDLIAHTASNVSIFQERLVTREEAGWALAVIMRYARVVHPHQDVRDSRSPRMYLIPLVELLGVELHQDPGVGITFQEEIVAENKVEEEVVLQIARRDMAKGEEVFVWPGRFSNSDMIVRHGMAFTYNRVGIGRNVTQPPNWEENPHSKVRREYEKYNCSNLESFELRFSTAGTPMRSWVRCYRVSWFMTNGWYSPALQKRKRELEKWPPPTKYTKEDWLSWTQADAELNRVMLEYCRMMKQQLKDSIDSGIASDFRKSKDPMDRLLWHLRGEESKTFKECVASAKRVHDGR